MQSICAVASCPGGRTESELLYRFPNDPRRSKQWVEKCPRKDLSDKTPEQLFRYYRICRKHFETSVLDGDADGTCLKEDAVPTVFDAQSSSQNGRLKRGKDTAKEDEVESRGRKKVKKPSSESAAEEPDQQAEGDDQRKYLQSLFEVILLLGHQGIPPTGPGTEDQSEVCQNNFSSVLDHRVRCGESALKRLCGAAELKRLVGACESSLRSAVLEEVHRSGFFSLITDEPITIQEQWHLPVFLRFADQSQRLHERFAGLLTLTGDGESAAEQMVSEMTEGWGVKLEQCRAQAHSSSGTRHRQVRAFASKLSQRFPRATLTYLSGRALNIALARSAALPGVQLVVSTFEKIESFFRQAPSLQPEFEHAISIVYPDKEKANEVKESCRGGGGVGWLQENRAFEVAVEVMEALLLCVDSVHDNEEMRWSDQVAHRALEISRAITDFEFLMALVVLKHVTALTHALGRSLQGSASEIYSAASNVKGVLQSLREVLDNLDVYQEFWTDEAVALASALENPVRVPRSYMRRHPPESGPVQTERYYREQLSLPVVEHVLAELSAMFGEEHLKSLRCLSLVPAVIEQHKAAPPEEDSIQVFNSDIPNVGTVSAELHCWWVKWSKKSKGETSPSSLQEALQLPDVKFFPNMLAVFRLASILPTLTPEGGCRGAALRRFRTYTANTPDRLQSRSAAFLSVNHDADVDLDAMVDDYEKMFPPERETPEPEVTD